MVVRRHSLSFVHACNSSLMHTRIVLFLCLSSNMTHVGDSQAFMQLYFFFCSEGIILIRKKKKKQQLMKRSRTGLMGHFSENSALAFSGTEAGVDAPRHE